MESAAGAKGKSRMCQFGCKSVHNNRSRWPGCHNMRQRSSTGLKRGGGGGEEERRILIKPGNDWRAFGSCSKSMCSNENIKWSMTTCSQRHFKTSGHIVLHPYNYHHVGKLCSASVRGSVAGFSFSVSLFDVLHQRLIPQTYKNTRREQGIDPHPQISDPALRGVSTYLLSC